MSVKVEIDREDIHRLNDAVDKLVKWTGKKKNDIVKEAGIAFAQSAQKYTPPDFGRKNIKASKYKRGVFKRQNKKYPGRKYTRYKVPYHTAQSKGAWWFDTKREANKRRYIRYRGLARAGWYTAIPKLGGTINYRTGRNPSKMLARARRRNTVMFSKGRDEAYVDIENNVINISRFAHYSKVQGLRMAGKRLKIIARSAERDIKHKWD